MQSIEEGTTPPGNGAADDRAARAARDRGWIRGPRPEMAYQCRNLDDVLAAVQFEVQTHCQGLIPEEVACRLQFALGSGLDHPKVRAEGGSSSSTDQHGFVTTATPTGTQLSKATNEPVDPDPCPGYSIAAALSNFYDAKEKLKYQRVVARAIVGAIGCADGFRYTERRTADTAKGDGYRLAFVCRESLQNKDKRVNRGQVRSGGEADQGTSSPIPFAGPFSEVLSGREREIDV